MGSVGVRFPQILLLGNNLGYENNGKVGYNSLEDLLKRQTSFREHSAPGSCVHPLQWSLAVTRQKRLIGVSPIRQVRPTAHPPPLGEGVERFHGTD